ncbi:hypothetical protein FQN57_002228 [Myotisia sp. PD_48]|nr:hypothetical protein FQN57_002228 [Myotisia sp. PD_48]
MDSPTDTKPPHVTDVRLDFPAPYVLLVTINRENRLNSLSFNAAWELERLWEWMDDRMDISTLQDSTVARAVTYPPGGFAGLTRRTGKKPIVVACNGFAYGGGFEIVLNSDIVIASEQAIFSFPDVQRGTAAIAGGLPRLCRNLTLQRAMQMALMAHKLTAIEAKEWGLVQKIVPAGRVVEEAIEAAKIIAGMSPDSIIVSRAGVRQAWETSSVEYATKLIWDSFAEKLILGENALEGMQAFVQKRRPVWRPSKL